MVSSRFLTCDSVEHCFVGIFLGDASPFQNLEGVVPAFYDVKIGGSFQLFDDRPQLVRRTEWVTRALNEPCLTGCLTFQIA
jgi:hypothetical protein